MQQKVLIIIMFALCWPMVMLAQKKEFKSGSGVYWEIKNDVLIISGNGEIGSYSNYPWSFKEYEKVIIEDGITYIGRDAFEFAKMESVEIGNSVKAIEKNAFYHCTNLRTVKFGNSLKKIGEWAFDLCNSIKSIEIPNSVKSIGDFAFSDCNSLQSVVFQSNTTSLGDGTFFKCINLESVTPESMVCTWPEAFSDFYSPKLTHKQLITGPNNTQYYIIRKNGKYGLTTLDGKEIVAMELDGLSEAGKGYLRFIIGGYCGIMNYQGKIIIPTSRGYTSIGNYVSLTKRFPYAMDGYKGECNYLGQQVSKIKVTKSKPTTTSSSGSSLSNSSSSSSKSSSSSNSENKATTVVVEHHRDPMPVQDWVPCSVCGHNPGVCQTCAGNGTSNSGSLCISCRGSGKCHFCNGHGGRYQIVYR